MPPRHADLVVRRLHSSLRARDGKRIYGLLIWHEPATFNPIFTHAFSPGMRDYLRSDPCYIEELNGLPDRMVKYGLLTDAEPHLEFLRQTPILASRGDSAASQSNLNGRAAVDVVCDMLTDAHLEHEREVKFGYDPRGYEYIWDVVVRTDKVELLLELKAQNKRGSAEVKLVYNHQAIRGIGGQLLDNARFSNQGQGS